MNRFKILAPFAYRGFRLLWAGLVVSLLGDGIFLVAVAWQAYAIHNNPSALAGVGVAMSAPQLALLLVGGAVSDRMPRRLVLQVADGARFAAVGAVAIFGWMGSLELWHLWAAAFVIGAGTAFAAPAFDAIVPEIVPEAALQPANAVDQFVRPLALRMLGPALGGVIVGALGTSTAFAVDAGTFALSAIFVSRIVGGRIQTEPSEGSSLWREMRAGISYVRRRAWLWGTFTAATFTYMLFLGPTEVLVPYLIRNVLGGNARTLGLVLGLGGVGSLAGALISGQRKQVDKPIRFIYLVWTMATILVVGYGVATKQWQLVPIAFAIGAFEAAGTVVWATLKQRLVPIDLLGRVSSIDWLVSTALMPLSFALTPAVAALVGVRATFIGAGVIGAAVTFAFMFVPGVRDPDRPGVLFETTPAAHE